MKLRYFLITLLAVYIAGCGFLVFNTGILSDCRICPQTLTALAAEANQPSENTAEDQPEQSTTEYANPAAQSSFDLNNPAAIGGTRQVITIGSDELNNPQGFLFKLNLDTLGASIARADSAIYDNRDKDNPLPFTLVSTFQTSSGKELMTMATQTLDLPEIGRRLILDKLNWRVLADEAGNKVRTDQDGAQQAVFEATIVDGNKEPIIRLIKSYKVFPGVHHVQCSLKAINLADVDLTARMSLQGPVGMVREGLRMDMRKVIGGYRNPQGQVETVKLENKDLSKQASQYFETGARGTGRGIRIAHSNPANHFIWAAAVSKYFAAIVRPVPDEGKYWQDHVLGGYATYYDPDFVNDPKAKHDGDETVGLTLKIRDFTLAAGPEKGSQRNFDFQIYLGAKDKQLFETHPLYSSIGFVHAIDFQTCFLFGWVTPLSFLILRLMNWMHIFIPNYGLVIIVLVLLVRLILHPVTKSSQVSMMKMGKLGPKVQEIQKKYADNKVEMNRRVGQLYKEQGAMPILGCLPMFLQMPIWFALYSAIYASPDLRGAGFLPFWITDLSAPDALITFQSFTVPLVGWQISSFNLLPVLLAVSMFLQQKLLSPTSAASSSPQAAQQQKIMMVMLPIMMLVFLYSAPSGLNLYIMASSFGSVIEQTVIRKHIREKEQQEQGGNVPVTSKTGGKVKKKKPKPFFKEYR